MDTVNVVAIRNATPVDAPLVVRFIHAIAEYQQLAEEAHPSEEALRAHLAEDADPRLCVLIAEVDGTPVGFAVYFFCYSTFETNWGLYLEDIYVEEAYRGRRIASALFRRLGEIARERGCMRLSFNVLKWNPAIDIYAKIGAVPLDDCVGMRIQGEALAALAR